MVKKSSNRSKNALGLILALVIFAIPIPARTQGNSQVLPPHELVSNTSLAPKKGRRIEIHVQDAGLTKEQCKLLIAHYHYLAVPDGQVSVQKPSIIFGGKLAPWCVDNIDSKGTFFNDDLFK